MNDTSTPRPGSGVNEDGRPWGEPKLGLTATVSLLSEGLKYCSDCCGRIDGRAVYITRELPNHRPPWQVVALLHPSCAGFEDE